MYKIKNKKNLPTFIKNSVLSLKENTIFKYFIIINVLIENWN